MRAMLGMPLHLVRDISVKQILAVFSNSLRGHGADPYQLQLSISTVHDWTRNQIGKRLCSCKRNWSLEVNLDIEHITGKPKEAIT